jgi:hypothetical protein
MVASAKGAAIPIASCAVERPWDAEGADVVVMNRSAFRLGGRDRGGAWEYDVTVGVGFGRRRRRTAEQQRSGGRTDSTDAVIAPRIGWRTRRGHYRRSAGTLWLRWLALGISWVMYPSSVHHIHHSPGTETQVPFIQQDGSIAPMVLRGCTLIQKSLSRFSDVVICKPAGSDHRSKSINLERQLSVSFQGEGPGARGRPSGLKWVWKRKSIPVAPRESPRSVQPFWWRWSASSLVVT